MKVNFEILQKKLLSALTFFASNEGFLEPGKALLWTAQRLSLSRAKTVFAPSKLPFRPVRLKLFRGNLFVDSILFSIFVACSRKKYNKRRRN